MSNCNKCGQEIGWAKIDEKNVPLNKDNTDHRKTCSGSSGTSSSPVAKTPAVTLECRISNLKAFIDLMGSCNIEEVNWPACAGVWNATR